MKTRARFNRTCLITLTLGVTAACGNAPGGSASRPKEEVREASTALGVSLAAMKEAAFDHVAKTMHVGVSNLSVIHQASVRYGEQSVLVQRFKVFDAESGNVHDVALDMQAKTVNTESLEERERQLIAQKYGKFDVALFEAMSDLDDRSSLTVAIWLRAELSTGIERPPSQARQSIDADAANRTALLKRLAEARAQRIQASVLAISTRLEKLTNSFSRDAQVPVINAALSAEAIREVASWPEVERLSLSTIGNESGHYQRDLVQSSQGVDGMIHQALGVTGAGAKIAVVGRHTRLPNHPYLPSNITTSNNYLCSGLSQHDLGMVGLMVSTFPEQYLKGVSPAAAIWHGGSCFSFKPAAQHYAEIQTETNEAAQWGAQIFVQSWDDDGSSMNALARYYDDLAANRWKLVLGATGNDGGEMDQSCLGNAGISAPAIGYNTVAVGAYDDKNTPSWSDNQVWECSVFKNPASVNADRKKPELFGPGVSLDLLRTDYPYHGYVGNGTSYATPIVAAVAALAIDAAPAARALEVWPEALRAVLFASAIDNMGRTAYNDRYDGIGGVYALGAVDIARGVNGNWLGESYDCNAPANKETVLYLNARRTRIALAWNNNPSFTAAYTSLSKPSADLDLRILAPNGSLVAWSASYDNTYEYVDFTPAVAGNYTVRIAKYRCDMSPMYIGWAWYQP